MIPKVKKFEIADIDKGDWGRPVPLSAIKHFRAGASYSLVIDNEVAAIFSLLVLPKNKAWVSMVVSSSIRKYKVALGKEVSKALRIVTAFYNTKEVLTSIPKDKPEYKRWLKFLGFKEDTTKPNLFIKHI